MEKIEQTSEDKSLQPTSFYEVAKDRFAHEQSRRERLLKIQYQHFYWGMLVFAAIARVAHEAREHFHDAGILWGAMVALATLGGLSLIVAAAIFTINQKPRIYHHPVEPTHIQESFDEFLEYAEQDAFKANELWKRMLGRTLLAAAQQNYNVTDLKQEDLNSLKGYLFFAAVTAILANFLSLFMPFGA